MKILIFAHQLGVGGSQTNAIDFAVALRDLHGHEVVIFATPGPMAKVVKEKGVRFLPAPFVKTHPSLAMMRALRETVRRERPELIHVWDYWQCFDAYVEHLLQRIPMVLSDMTSDNLRRFLPKMLPMTFGTPEFVDMARAAGRRRVELLVPPVDVHLNAPDAVDPRPFRERYGLKVGDLTMVIICRLDKCMKAEGLRRSIDAVRILGRDLPLRLVISGEGDASAELERMADKTNTELGRSAVVMTGVLLDPRPAYAAADIVIGMGGSALRGMAFGKPVIIVGVNGFSSPFTPETADSFYYKGIYGVGDGNLSSARLVADIRALAERPDEFPALGAFSRQFILRHFNIEDVSARLSELFYTAVAKSPRFSVAAIDGLRTVAICWGGRFVPDGIRRLLKKHESKKLMGKSSGRAGNVQVIEACASESVR